MRQGTAGLAVAWPGMNWHHNARILKQLTENSRAWPGSAWLGVARQGFLHKGNSHEITEISRHTNHRERVK